MEIIRLDKEAFAGRKFTVRYTTGGYYDIQAVESGFHIQYQSFGGPREMSFDDQFLADWLEEPTAFGAFEDGQSANAPLLGYVEGFLEKWNNRYRISNICVFDEARRRSGIGTLLMDRILTEAAASGARMAVLETQTCNEKAIAFYRKHGFTLIGFDLFSYTNSDPERHEIRIEMGKKLR